MMKQNDKLREEDRPVGVHIAEGMLRVQLQDGREIATPEQRSNLELSLSGIYWPELDEDLSVAGMLRGIRPPQHRQKTREAQ